MPPRLTTSRRSSTPWCRRTWEAAGARGSTLSLSQIRPFLVGDLGLLMGFSAICGCSSFIVLVLVAVQPRSMDPSKDLAAYGYGSVAWKERMEGWKHKQERLQQLRSEGGGDWDGDGDADLPLYVPQLCFTILGLLTTLVTSTLCVLELVELLLIALKATYSARVLSNLYQIGRAHV